MPSPPQGEAFGVREMVSDFSSRRKRISIIVGLARMDSNPMISPAANSFPKMPFYGHFLNFRFENQELRRWICFEDHRARVNAYNLSKP
jgi:hypothetical protein